MGKPFGDSPVALAEALKPSPPPAPLEWQDAPPLSPPSLQDTIAAVEVIGWDLVSGLEDQQRRSIDRINSQGVLWRNPRDPLSPAVVFRLAHGGGVETDGNCLFTAGRRALGTNVSARELRRITVRRFLDDYENYDWSSRKAVDAAIEHLYSPDITLGWRIHVVQELKMIVKKQDRMDVYSAIEELTDLGLQREVAAESIYKERCIPVNDGDSWAIYMSISGSSEDEYDIVTLQYTEEGLLTIDENHDGHAAAFGDDFAIESLSTELMREVYVVQAHGSDAMIDDENGVFFLPHRPRGRICGPPIFLFMKGTGWCGAGADHYEPLVAIPIQLSSHEKAAVVL